MTEAQHGLFEVEQAAASPAPAAPRRLLVEVSSRLSSAVESAAGTHAAFGVVIRDGGSGERVAELAETCDAPPDDTEPPETGADRIVRTTCAGVVAGLELAREADPSAELEVRVAERAVAERMAAGTTPSDSAESVPDVEGVVWTWVPRGDAPAADALAEAALSGSPTRRVSLRARDRSGGRSST